MRNQVIFHCCTKFGLKSLIKDTKFDLPVDSFLYINVDKLIRNLVFNFQILYFKTTIFINF